jgi:hypothetical protein
VRESVYLHYRYKSANTDAEGATRLLKLTLTENAALASPPAKIIAKGVTQILEYQRRYEVFVC